MFYLASTRRESITRNVLGRVLSNSGKPALMSFFDPDDAGEVFDELDEDNMEDEDGVYEATREN